MKLPDFEQKLQERIAHFKSQLAALRVGFLSLDNIGSLRVVAYGSSMMVRELANLTASGPGELVVACWDKSVIGEVERGLRGINNPGFSVAVDGDLIRLKVTALTQERREALVKEIGRLKEDTKVSIRLVRQDQMRALDEMEEQGEISEDDKFIQRGEVERVVKEANLEVDKLAEEKSCLVTTL
ncbi:MAG: ribosome-recycling factor [bacterium]